MGEEFGRAPGAPDVPSHFLSYPSLPSASLVPVYSFGENDIFRVKAFAPDSWQHLFQTTFKQLMYFSPCILWGCGLFSAKS